MKWLIFVLIGANIILFAVQLFKVREDRVEKAYHQLGKEIVLLSELEQAQLKPLGTRCLLVGPIMESEKPVFEQWRAKLNDAGIKSDITKQIMNSEAVFEVIYPVPKGVSAGLLIDALRGLGIDASLVKGAGRVSTLLLGRYRNLDLARQLKKKLSDNGYEVKIEEKHAQEKRFWLLVSVQKSLVYKEKIAEIASTLGEGKKMREILCKSVASENNFP